MPVYNPRLNTLLHSSSSKRSRILMADERTKAIDLAFAQIEKQFGKGSIMRLGSKEHRTHRRNSDRRRFLSTQRWAWAASRGGASLKSSGRNLPARPPSHYRWSRRRRRPAAWRLLSMPNMRSIPRMPRNSAWMSITCWFPSPITASRRSRSPKRWSAPARSTCWLWIQWPRSSPRPNSMAKWATATWACRRG